jgi:hypothetical protein
MTAQPAHNPLGARNNTTTIIAFPGVRIEPFDSGGWLVITEHGHAWAFGDRPSALQEKRWHDRQWGRGR